MKAQLEYWCWNIGLIRYCYTCDAINWWPRTLHHRHHGCIMMRVRFDKK